MSAAAIPKVSGTVLLGAVQALRRAQDALEVPPQLQHYLTDRIEILSWYAERDLQAIMELLAARHPDGVEAGWRQMGRALGELHLGTVYRRHVENDLQAAVGLMWRAQHDTGTLTISITDGEVALRLAEFGAPHPHVCASFTGYLDVLLERSPLEVGPLAKQRCCAKGDAVCLWTAARAG